ncbi:sigma-54 interaction domain-containing protein [Vreelandella zhanjiangensis]|uniref:sigma-54 interaction domain-containing protein n=1 Tax=Vreelandella zhanjiangensis TaxID=1121960 RepID=UPI00035EF7CE|nr:sigma-54 dependent transcriptional regulator [Halomonas zhanjiangensis]
MTAIATVPKAPSEHLWQRELAAMPLALRLAESPAPIVLRERVSELLRHEVGLAWAACLYLEGSGRWLGLDNSDAQFDCSDFRHPYAHVVRSGKPLLLSVRDARTRLDHPDFQAQIARLDPKLHLLIRPLRGEDGRKTWLGALVMAGDSCMLEALVNDSGMGALETLVCQLWQRLSQEQGERQRSQVLKESLAKLNDGARRQTLADQLGKDLLGQSSAMQALRRKVVRAAETSLAVLLQGETGTGKDCVARALHQLSARSKGPFMAINCAAIPEALLESELFGHEKGAFSGADHAREGLISQADGGTLFLDEIGDMPLALQAKLLRVLESGCYRPLGASDERYADLRLVAATHQPLREHISEKRFRADLYYRLGQFPLTLPPLSERQGDIVMLVECFIADFCAREGRHEMGITPSALRVLNTRDYPGNVRELKNLVDYACAMTPDGADIDVDMLPAIQTEAPDLSPSMPLAPQEKLSFLDNVDDLKEALRDVEAAIIRQRLAHFDGNRTQVAKSLGLPKRTLAHKCRLLQLDTK